MLLMSRIQELLKVGNDKINIRKFTYLRSIHFARRAFQDDLNLLFLDITKN